MKKIIVNKIMCNHCGDIIESTYIHDYKQCKCGKCSIDGGHEYLKRGFQEQNDYKDLSEIGEV